MEEKTSAVPSSMQQLSHYNPETNRCYVKLEVETAEISRVLLYDGQTKEMLASITRQGKGRNEKFADIDSDSLSKFVHDPASPSYDETKAVIEKFMAEDRKP